MISFTSLKANGNAPMLQWDSGRRNKIRADFAAHLLLPRLCSVHPVKGYFSLGETLYFYHMLIETHENT